MFSFTFFTGNSLFHTQKHQSNNKEWAYYHTAYFKYTHHLCLWFSVKEPKVGQSCHILKILDWSPRNFHFKLHHTSTEPHGGQWLILTSNFYVHGNKNSNYCSPSQNGGRLNSFLELSLNSRLCILKPFFRCFKKHLLHIHSEQKVWIDS